jgi:pantoate--beta-alanine ligase
MILFKKAADLRKWLDVQGKKSKNTGFVPTMGALHAGHISLIELSKKKSQITVCSIFINPTQFNDGKDFVKYPVTLEKDISLLETAGCDVLFLPSVDEIYPNGLKQNKYYDLDYLETLLEGKFRPGHFQGVCDVVRRLLDIVQPDVLYLGQKDYQQCMVITRLIGLIKKDKKIKIAICPTLRESDGLAMSSRNMRLTEHDRKKAGTIYKSLHRVKEKIQQGNLNELQLEARKMLEKAGFKVDYFEIVDAKNLSTINKWDGKQKLVAVVAAFINEVRLIDNLLLN